RYADRVVSPPLAARGRRVHRLLPRLYVDDAGSESFASRTETLRRMRPLHATEPLAHFPPARLDATGEERDVLIDHSHVRRFLPAAPKRIEGDLEITHRSREPANALEEPLGPPPRAAAQHPAPHRE